MVKGDCIFCKIVKGDVPSKKVYEDGMVYAFHDIQPAAPIHVLIIPKKHIKNLASATAKDKSYLGQCQIAAGKVAKKVGVSSAFRLLTANGKEAGQSVYHLHYHLIGGWRGKAPEMEVDPGSLGET